MTQPIVLDEKPISMSELKEEVEKIKKRDKELNLRLQKTEEYLNEFMPLSAHKGKELFEKLMKLNVPRLKELHINKIIDTLPSNINELKAVLQAYTLTISNENLNKIVDSVNSFVGEKK